MQFSERQQELTFPSSSRALLLLDEKIVEIPAHEEDGMRTEATTVYEYQGCFLTVVAPTRDAVLSALREKLVEEILAYDSSPAVNSFYLNGKRMWLDKAMRNGLLMRLDAEERAGVSETTLWYGGVPVSLPVAQAKEMLLQLEVYASRCYDRTQEHLQASSRLTEFGEVAGYDYEDGYPEQLLSNL